MARRPVAVLALLLSLAGLLGIAGPVAPCDAKSGDFCGLPRAEDLVFVPAGRRQLKGFDRPVAVVTVERPR